MRICFRQSHILPYCASNSRVADLLQTKVYPAILCKQLQSGGSASDKGISCHTVKATPEWRICFRQRYILPYCESNSRVADLLQTKVYPAILCKQLQSGGSASDKKVYPAILSKLRQSGGSASVTSSNTERATPEWRIYFRQSHPATLSKKLQSKLAVSTGHTILTPGQPVRALTA